MARACVEDTCSIIAGNGTGNPNALALTSRLDPNGGLHCTPGVGLGINTLGAGGCHNILKLSAGALSVEQPGIDANLFTSLGLVNIPIVAPPTAATHIPLTAGLNIFNPFIGCQAIAVAYVNIQFQYNITTNGVPYWMQATSGIDTTGGTPLGSGIHELDDNSFNGQGAGTDIAQQYDVSQAVLLAPAGSTTFTPYHRTPVQQAGGAGNDASLNIRTNQSPQARADGYVLVYKFGVVN